MQRVAIVEPLRAALRYPFSLPLARHGADGDIRSTILGHALHEIRRFTKTNMQRQIDVGTLVSSQKQRALPVSFINLT